MLGDFVQTYERWQEKSSVPNPNNNLVQIRIQIGEPVPFKYGSGFFFLFLLGSSIYMISRADGRIRNRNNNGVQKVRIQNKKSTVLKEKMILKFFKTNFLFSCQWQYKTAQKGKKQACIMLNYIMHKSCN